MSNYFAHPTSIIDEPCMIGDGTKIWHFCHVMKNSEIGSNCVLGQNVHIAEYVKIGNYVKIQNNVSLFTGVTLEDFVFCGPSCVFTNVINPRSEISRQNEYKSILVQRGATIGANATIICGATIGKYAFIGAGAVVPARTIPDYALMIGVPAIQKGWMSRHGYKLIETSPDQYICPVSGLKYQRITKDQIICVDLPENESLPGDREQL